MSQNVYECLFLLDSNRYARDPNGVSAGLTETVEKLDGEVLASRLWNEQKLAYPVNGHRKGTYWIIYFRNEGSRLPEFERACRLNDNVLRNLTLAVDPRLVDALVSHVKGTDSEEAEAEAAKSSEPEAEAAKSSEPEAEAAKSSEPEAEAAESSEPEAEAAESSEPEAEAVESSDEESKATESAKDDGDSDKQAIAEEAVDEDAVDEDAGGDDAVAEEPAGEEN